MMDSPGSSPAPDAPRPSAIPPPRNGRPPRRQADEKAQHYSLDDMMSRLKKPSGGSSRRRRSEQNAAAQKPAARAAATAAAPYGGLSKRVKWVGITGIVLALMLLAGIFTYRALIRLRVEGDNFRANTGRRLTELLQRRTGLESVRLEPGGGLSTTALTVVMQPGDLLENAALRNVRTTLSSASWMGRDWEVTDLRFRGGRLDFNPNKPAVPANLWAVPTVSAARGAEEGESVRFGISANPSIITVKGGRFEQLTLAWPGPQGQPGTLTDLEGLFHKNDETLEASMIRGLLTTSLFPPLPVGRLNVRLQGTKLQIIAAEIMLDDSPAALFSGKTDLRPEGRLDLEGTVSGARLKHLLPAAWSERVLGQLNSTSVTWASTFRAGGPPPELKGPLKIRGLVLRELPFIDKISTVLQTPALKQYEFPEMTGSFSWTPEKTVLTGLSAERPGMLRLSGNVEISAGGAVTGLIKVDVHTLMLANIGGIIPAGFVPSPQQGWSGVEFSIGGTSAGVTDNLVVSQPPPGQAQTPGEATLVRPAAASLPVAPPSAVRPPVPAPVPVPASRPQPLPTAAEEERAFFELIKK